MSKKRKAGANTTSFKAAQLACGDSRTEPVDAIQDSQTLAISEANASELRDSEFNFTSLPNELSGAILEFLGMRDLIKLRQTSKRILEIVDSLVPDFQLIPRVLQCTDRKVSCFGCQIFILVLKVL